MKKWRNTLSIKNVNLNPELSKRIQLFNLGVSDKCGKINIHSMDSVLGYADEGASYDIEIISLEEIINKFHPNFLKMDCEGCEFGIIMNIDLSSFDEILFEHHSEIAGYDYKILMKKLKENGFKIKTSNVFDKSFDDLGLIYAYKWGYNFAQMIINLLYLINFIFLFLWWTDFI